MCGMKFSSMSGVYDHCSELNGKFEAAILPAIIEFGCESGVPGSSQPWGPGNGINIYACLFWKLYNLLLL